MVGANPFERRGYRKSTAVDILHLWAFIACYGEKSTFYPAFIVGVKELDSRNWGNPWM
jgi:hypothetical protein